MSGFTIIIRFFNLTIFRVILFPSGVHDHSNTVSLHVTIIIISLCQFQFLPIVLFQYFIVLFCYLYTYTCQSIRFDRTIQLVNQPLQISCCLRYHQQPSLLLQPLVFIFCVMVLFLLINSFDFVFVRLNVYTHCLCACLFLYFFVTNLPVFLVYKSNNMEFVRESNPFYQHVFKK